LLVSQIMAQRTKVNPWEIQNTKVDIVSFVILDFRASVSANHLIYSLQSSRLNESVFFFGWYLVWAPLAFITAPILLGLLSTTFLQTSFGVLSHSTSTCPKSSSTPAGGAHRH